MSETLESKKQFETLEKSIEQLNYLMVGLYGGVISFSAQGVSTENLFLLQYFALIGGIVILLIGMGFSIFLLNHKVWEKHFKWLDIKYGEVLDEKTQTHTPAELYVPRLSLGAFEKDADRHANRAQLFAKLRNWLLLMGIAVLFIGRLIVPLWKH